LGGAGATCGLDKGAVLTQLCSWWLYGIEVEVSVSHKPKFGPSAFSGSPQSGAHGTKTSHACHTLDTPLVFGTC